jgi:succinate-acetate transporter protein
VLCQLSYTPRLRLQCIRGASGIIWRVGRLSMPLLFSFLTLIFVVIGVASATHGRWVITVAAVAIGVWMASFAWQALRRMRR